MYQNVEPPELSDRVRCSEKAPECYCKCASASADDAKDAPKASKNVNFARTQFDIGNQ